MPSNENTEITETLNSVQRLRRVMMLSLFCIKNAAYYRARAEGNLPDFWQTCANNNIDMCVLDWCKLFTDRTGKHSWKRVVNDCDNFMERMLTQLNVNEGQFQEYFE